MYGSILKRKAHLSEVTTSNIKATLLFYDLSPRYLGPGVFPLSGAVLVIDKVNSPIWLNTLLPAIWQRPLKIKSLYQSNECCTCIPLWEDSKSAAFSYEISPTSWEQCLSYTTCQCCYIITTMTERQPWSWSMIMNQGYDHDHDHGQTITIRTKWLWPFKDS